MEAGILKQSPRNGVVKQQQLKTKGNSTQEVKASRPKSANGAKQLVESISEKKPSLFKGTTATEQQKLESASTTVTKLSKAAAQKTKACHTSSSRCTTCWSS